MCKTGFSIREDGIRCKVCGADSAVTPVAERSGVNFDFDFDYAICEICVETGMEETIGVGNDDRAYIRPSEMQAHINRAMNVAVEQISARMIEYLDSMGGSRG